MAGSWWIQHRWVGSENEGSWERTSQRKEAIRISRAHLQHQKPGYSLKLFHKGKAIRRKLNENCLKEGHADPSLIARWKTHSPENVCCLRCIRMLGCRLWKKWHLPGSPKPAGNLQDHGVCAQWLQSDQDPRCTLTLPLWKWSTLRISGSATGALNTEPSVVISTPISNTHLRPQQ